MIKFYQITLEFIRPGPPHNQLLSPLTPYMALCGEGSPITFNINIEHHQLLSRLECLRYVTAEGRGGVAVPDRIREAAVSEIGGEISRILSKAQTLLAEEWKAVGKAGTNAGRVGPQMVHLRLILSGSELSLVPFEMAIAPQAFPGEALELTLQSHIPIVLTREIRRTRPSPLRWDHSTKPTILFISAAPAGLDIPLESHVNALRSAVEPWVRWPKRTKEDKQPGPGPHEVHGQRLPLIKERLRLLPNASIESIYEICSKQQFTHIHILAHGDYSDVGGERRFGLALCQHGKPTLKEVVSGKRLAEALQAEGKNGSCRSHPLLVTLMTCDSGNPGSVLVPGGSIAHDLHAAGIPWVFASQFPLTKAGSVRITNGLYPRFLRGEDPRQALYEVRRQLHMSAERDHDWASLVAYSTVPDDFDEEVITFCEQQIRWAISIALDRADDAATDDEMKIALETAREWLDFWKGRLPEGDGGKERSRRAEYYGICGSTLKRIGLLHYHRKEEILGRATLKESLAAYRKAIDQWAVDEEKYHWVATQALFLIAALGQPPEPETFLLAYKLAERDLNRGSGTLKAWGYGTMAELEMLAIYHIPDRKAENVSKLVEEHCRALFKLMGEGSFEVDSTRRQFQRYINYYEFWEKLKVCRPIAEKAVEALSPTGGVSHS